MNLSRLHRRSAFTLIELLVVIAIIAVLIGLLLPAVQKVRAAAAQTACQNNLHQIGLAALNYESSHGTLPPGLSYNPVTGAGSYIGPFPYMLPYLEQGAIYNELPATLFAQTTGDAWWGGGGGWTGANNWIKIFECPADNLQSVTPSSGIFAYLYAQNLSYNGGVFAPQYPTLGCTNYVGCAGCLGDVANDNTVAADASSDVFYGQYVGVYADTYGIRLVNILDGTSNTIGFGETIGGADTGTRNYTLSWMGASGMAAYWMLPEPSSWDTFGSKHGTIVNFAFCDGSVRPLFKCGSCTGNYAWLGSSWYLFQEAAGYKDGAVVNFNLIGP